MPKRKFTFEKMLKDKKKIYPNGKISPDRSHWQLPSCARVTGVKPVAFFSMGAWQSCLLLKSNLSCQAVWTQVCYLLEKSSFDSPIWPLMLDWIFPQTFARKNGGSLLLFGRLVPIFIFPILPQGSFRTIFLRMVY